MNLPKSNKDTALHELVDHTHPLFESFESAETIPLGAGSNSYAYKFGSSVVKVSRKQFTDEAAYHHAAILQGEQALLSQFVGDSLPETDYHIVPSAKETDEKQRVVSVQPFIGGIGLAEFLRQNDSDTDSFINFLKNSLAMYKSTGHIPDIGNIQTGFNVSRTRNVLINDNNVVLVDTNFGKIQRSKGAAGKMWRHGIATGARRSLKSLTSKSA